MEYKDSYNDQKLITKSTRNSIEKPKSNSKQTSHLLPFRAKTLEYKPTQPAIILNILKLGGGTTSIKEPTLSPSWRFLISSYYCLWVKVFRPDVLSVFSTFLLL